MRLDPQPVYLVTGNYSPTENISGIKDKKSMMISLLYVDDEPDLLAICRAFLERDGEFSVTTANSVDEGLNRLTTGGIEAIVSDYQMPETTGIEFLKKVRATGSDIPFILFTGRGREDVVIEAINNGVDFYLQKGGEPRAQFSELGLKIRQAVRRKRAEDELRVAYERNKGLMDHANDSIFITDMETSMLLDANKKALELTRRTLHEIRAMNQRELIPYPASDRFPDSFGQRLAEGKWVEEEIVVDREGKQIPVIVSATVIELGGKHCVMSICHDISEIKKTQEALQLANKKLNLLADITRHDIRNKLTVMKGYLELFRDHPPEPTHSMYLAKLKDTVNTIGMTIEFTKLYQNLGVVAPTWQIVHEVFMRACTHADVKRIRVTSEVDGLSIFADPLLERVFYNLVDNSVEHGSRVKEIRLAFCETAEDLVITIEDDGVGIPEYDKEKIFTRGFGKNTGLGLFLAREILSTTAITIAETGQYQAGARFEIRVPKGGYRFPLIVPVPGTVPVKT